MNIKDLADLWRGFKADTIANHARMLLHSKREMEIRGCEEYSLVIRANQTDLKKELLKSASSFIRLVFGHAEKHFAHEGTRLKIDQDMILGRLGLHRDRTHLKVDVLWNAIEAEYGGSKGAEASYGQAVDTLVRRFNLDGQSEIKTVKGCMQLSLSIYLDSFALKRTGTYRLENSSQKEVLDVFAAFGAFALWSNRGDLAGELLHHPWAFDRSVNDVINPKEHVIFGANEIDVWTLKNRFDFTFNKAIGDELNIFISTYREQALKIAA